VHKPPTILYLHVKPVVVPGLW